MILKADYQRKGRQRENLQRLVHFPDVNSGWSWVRLSSGRWAPSGFLTRWCLLITWNVRRSWIGSGTAGIKPALGLIRMLVSHISYINTTLQCCFSNRLVRISVWIICKCVQKSHLFFIQSILIVYQGLCTYNILLYCSNCVSFGHCHYFVWLLCRLNNHPKLRLLSLLAFLYFSVLAYLLAL